MKTTVLLVVMTALSVSSVSFTPALAAESEKSEGFAKRKAEILEKLDEVIKKTQEHRNCVSQAADQEALKKCRESMQQFKEEQKEERKSRQERRRERLEQRKAAKQ